MTFQFESFSAFLQMGGHGPFVWACYAITIAALIFLVARPSSQIKALKRSVQRQQKIAQNTR